MSSRRRKTIARQALREAKRECARPRCMTRPEGLRIVVWSFQRGYASRRNWGYAVKGGMVWDLSPPGYRVVIGEVDS